MGIVIRIRIIVPIIVVKNMRLLCYLKQEIAIIMAYNSQNYDQECYRSFRQHINDITMLINAYFSLDIC